MMQTVKMMMRGVSSPELSSRVGATAGDTTTSENIMSLNIYLFYAILCKAPKSILLWILVYIDSYYH